MSVISASTVSSSQMVLMDLVLICRTRIVQTVAISSAKNGQDIPFETFLGFDGDKVPDIDLNFSGEDQPSAHLDVRDIFGEEYAFRAGTVGTVAAKTAYGFVKGYERDFGKYYRDAEVERLALGALGSNGRLVSTRGNRCYSKLYGCL